MARQNTAPVAFNKSVRTDEGVLMSSGRAGKVIPVAYVPLLRGDSAAGRMSFDFNLAEMPKPLLNAAFLNVQAWFVPKSIHPQFTGHDEFFASYMGVDVKASTPGGGNRASPKFFPVVTTSAATKPSAVDFFKTLGLHWSDTAKFHTDLVDAFNLVYNFRLMAHSTKLPRKKYWFEDVAEAVKLPRAFWPSGRFRNIVPDYERALIIGQLDLDVAAGIIPVRGLLRAPQQNPLNTAPPSPNVVNVNDTNQYVSKDTMHSLYVNSALPLNQQVWAEFGGGTGIQATLADIDKARLTQSFAKLRASMAGNNSTGFVDDNMILAHLLQGLSVPADMFKRPMLLDSRRVPFGFAERFATDSGHLDDSVSTGRSSVEMSINVPTTETGGVIMVTAEVLPERIDERQRDEWLHIEDPVFLPDALRDIQNPEPVDRVASGRIDARHKTPDALYGYEPMNDKWNRSFTRLGGSFYAETPGAPVTEPRAGIWQAHIVDPAFTADHWLAPEDFPHNVFADTQKPAFEFVARHSLKIVGLTQIGDVLNENNADWSAVEGDMA